MISTQPLKNSLDQYDVILISGDYWADHPHSGVGVIARVLDSKGYCIGIIEKPNWKSNQDFLRLGLPRFFYGITSGAVDSMLVNYTPLKKRRENDPHKAHHSLIPDRAVIVYAQKVRETQKIMIKKQDLYENYSIPIILGGVEASLRRFTHYDYWANDIRRPILFDAKADLLVYGPGEKQIIEIIKRIEQGQSIKGIEGTCIIAKEIPKEDSFEEIPSFDKVSQDKKEFCHMQLKLSNERNLAQKIDHRFLIQYKSPYYTTEDLDSIYSMPFSYQIPEQFKEFDMAKFSIITHRGCFGNCNFCAIALHQGTRIISRTIPNIICEIQKMQKMKDFKGYISDLGGPSANMYGMECKSSCNHSCIREGILCKNMNLSHEYVLQLLQQTRQLFGIKKIFVRSGIRFDLSVDADDYLKELIQHHISGTLKIAPEHFSPQVLKLMNKNSDKFDRFLEKFNRFNRDLKQSLRYYFLTAHPGSTMEEVKSLKVRLKQLQNIENVQIFTPTPMTISTCMYYTGLNPFTLQPIYIPYTYNEKKRQKNFLFEKPNNKMED